MATYPQTRRIWNVGEQTLGNIGSYDPAMLQTTKRAFSTLKFGAPVENSVNGLIVPTLSTTKIFGIGLVDNYAADYANGQYLAQDAVAVLKRGTVFVPIDTTNKPVVGGAVIWKVVDGTLTSLTTGGVLATVSQEVEILQVLDNMAEIRLFGSSEITVAYTA